MHIKSLFDENYLLELTKRFKIDSFIPLPGFMNLLYQCNWNKYEFVLRISHSSRRNERMIQAEIDWINYLLANGVSVVKHEIIGNQNSFEVFPDKNSGYFIATLFRKIQGRHLVSSDLTNTFFLNYGQQIGKMHKLSKAYKPKNNIFTRPEWHEEIILDAARNIPRSETLVYNRFIDLIEHLKGLSKNEQCFGLIHQDLHIGNYFIDNTDKLTIFDFDDCTYSWFINDIAIVIFYIVLWNPENTINYLKNFLHHFLSGYFKEQDIDKCWFNEIPFFLKLREFDIFTLIYNNYDGKIADSHWAINFMKDRKTKIEQNVPYLDFDFCSIF